MDPYVKLIRDPKVEDMVTGWSETCFACRNKSEFVPQLLYLQEMQLFKHLILQKTNLSPSIVKTFEANLHTCSECLQLILALCGMNQQIIAIQREMDKIVDSVKNSLQERDNQLGTMHNCSDS